jgi:iron complex transport system ATP-binding protein
MMDQAPLLSFDHITFGYQPNGRAVLHALSLGIEPGTVTAILGPNGAGKTTLLHLALGWLTPQSGQVQLDGRSLGSYSRRKLGQWMALVPQSERIPFDYSILEYVLLGRAPYLAPLDMPGAQDCQISERVIEQVGLGCLNGRAVTTLSGGERQLALVARALAQQPRLLLLDEPTSHLDLANKARLIKLMQELAARGVTLLLTTHEPDVAAAIATHLVLMRDGQVYQTGPLSQVFTAEHLSATYNVPVSVAQVDGRRIALWT